MHAAYLLVDGGVRDPGLIRRLIEVLTVHLTCMT